MRQLWIAIVLMLLVACWNESEKHLEQFIQHNNAAIEQENYLFDSSSNAIDYKIVSGRDVICEYNYIYDDPKVSDDEFSRQIYFIIPDSNKLTKEVSYAVPNDNFRL